MRCYTLGLYEKALPGSLGWEEKFLLTKKAGFDYLEISIDETKDKLSRLDMTKEERLELVRLMYETGLPIRTMCLSGHRKYPLGSADPQVCGRGMEIMEKAVKLAEDLGIRLIQLAGYDVYYEESTEETRQRFCDNLEKAVNLAARAGVLLGFETMETEFMDTVEKAMKYVSQQQSPYLNVYPDTGNLTNAADTHGVDILADLQKGEGRIAALHLKESLPGKFREVPFGKGHVDFFQIIGAAWKMGVRKYTAELWYTGGEEWLENVYFAGRMMSGILDKMA